MKQKVILAEEVRGFHQYMKDAFGQLYEILQFSGRDIPEISPDFEVKLVWYADFILRIVIENNNHSARKMLNEILE